MSNFNSSFPLSSAPQSFSQGSSVQTTLPPPSQNIEISSVRRGGPGRPLGSKNKPKVDNSAILMPLILIVPHDVDLIEWVKNYADSNMVHLAILCGTGSLLAADLSRLGSQTAVEEYTELLTLIDFTGIYMSSGLDNGSLDHFTASLRRVNGDLVSGTALKLMTVDDVSLTAVIFQKPEILTIKAAEHMIVESSSKMLINRNLKWSGILKLEPGIDVIQTVARFAVTCSLQVSVYCSRGLVSELDIGYPPSHSLSYKLSGNFQIISFSGTCDGRNATSIDNINRCFYVSVAGHNNLFASGIVTGMKAMSHVTLLLISASDAP